MIAHHREDAVLGLDARQQLSEGVDLPWSTILQVACEHHHIGILRIDAVDGLFQQMTARACQRTTVYVADLHNLIAIERGRQIVEGQFDITHPELIHSNVGTIKEHQPKKHEGRREYYFQPEALAEAPQQHEQYCEEYEDAPPYIDIGVGVQEGDRCGKYTIHRFAVRNFLILSMGICRRRA